MSLLAPDDPWASYARTVVEIVRRGEGDLLVVRAAPTGGHGAWPWPAEDAVPVLTAWNPGPARPGLAANRRRQAELESALSPHAARLLPAVGVDPESGHREEGVAVLGVAVEEAMALGARFGQDAIFVWTPTVWAIVSCRDDRRAEFGWSVALLRPT